MNILILGGFPNTAKAVAAAGGDVTLIFDGARLPRNFAEIKNGPVRYLLSKSVDEVSLTSIFRGAKELHQVIREHAFEVVHANGTIHLLKAWLAKLLLRLSGNCRPVVVVSMHDSTPWIFEVNHWRNRLITQLIRCCADLAIPVAKFIREIFISYGIKRDKAIIITNALDLELFDRRLQLPPDRCMDFLPSPKPYAIVTYIAAFHPFKGHEYYLQAAQIVWREHPQAKFLVVGSGRWKMHLEQMAQDLGIKEHVIFTGDIPPAAVPQLLFSSDVPVCASLSEMCPYAVLEAMAARKTIVATAVGGIPDLVQHQVTGILVPPANAEALAAGILMLLKDSERRRTMGQAARKWVEAHHNLQVIGKQLMRAYNMALKR